MSKTQVGGDHYSKLAISPFDYSLANGLDAMQHSVVKYVTRFRDKNGMEDLRKAADVLDQLIKYELNNVEEADEVFPTVKIPISDTAAAELISKLQATPTPINRIVAIPRGGLSIAHVIAEHLNIKDVEIYNPSITYGDTVLLVDDINDSGATLMEILSKPNHFLKRPTTAVLAQRYSSKIYCDFVGEGIEHDDYVLFPWEAS